MTVRRFGLLSVFRFSLVMSFCMMLVIWLALLIIFLVLQAVGVTDTIAEWIGCLFALVWTALGVFFALLYNLISDIVGGVEVTLSERRH